MPSVHPGGRFEICQNARFLRVRHQLEESFRSKSMPTIIRKPVHTIIETRREILHAISWQVRSSLWRTPTDILETDEYFIIKVEIAGMREDDIEVAVENNLLRISGNRSDMPEQRAYYHQMEIQSGKFEIMAEIPVS